MFKVSFEFSPFLLFPPPCHALGMPLGVWCTRLPAQITSSVCRLHSSTDISHSYNLKVSSSERRVDAIRPRRS